MWGASVSQGSSEVWVGTHMKGAKLRLTLPSPSIETVLIDLAAYRQGRRLRLHDKCAQYCQSRFQRWTKADNGRWDDISGYTRQVDGTSAELPPASTEERLN